MYHRSSAWGSGRLSQTLIHLYKVLIVNLPLLSFLGRCQTEEHHRWTVCALPWVGYTWSTPYGTPGCVHCRRPCPQSCVLYRKYTSLLCRETAEPRASRIYQAVICALCIYIRLLRATVSIDSSHYCTYLSLPRWLLMCGACAESTPSACCDITEITQEPGQEILIYVLFADYGWNFILRYWSIDWNYSHSFSLTISLALCFLLMFSK